jgi:hypothetical protein
MSFYSSQSRSSTSTIAHASNRQICDETDFDRYCKENAKWLEAAGIKTIDFHVRQLSPANFPDLIPKS